MKRILIVTLLLLLPISSFAATLEVGSGKPYTTIQAAVDAVKAGDTILVYNGTYTENLLISGKTGTLTNQFILQVAPGNTAAIDGNYANNTVNITGSSHYWTIDGFNIKNAGNTYFGVRIYTSDYITIKNNTIYQDSKTAIGTAITSINSQPLYVYNNIIHTWKDYSMDIADRTDNFEAHDNIIFDVDIGIKCARNVNCKIYNNWIYGTNGPDYGYAIYLRDTQNARVYNNMMESSNFSSVGAFQIYRYGAEDNLDGQIYNNTVVSLNGGTAITMDNGSTHGFIIKNNIFHGFSVGISFGSATNNNHYGWNDFSNCLTNVVNKGTNNVNDSGNISDNAVFVTSGNKPAPYYKLQAGSPAINAGDPSIKVPQSWGIIDIGRYEWTSTGNMPNTPTGLTVQ